MCDGAHRSDCAKAQWFLFALFVLLISVLADPVIHGDSMRCFLVEFRRGDSGDSGAEAIALRKDSWLTIQIYTPEMLWNQCMWRLRVSRKRNKCFSG